MYNCIHEKAIKPSCILTRNLHTNVLSRVVKLLLIVIVIIKHLWSSRLYFCILITDADTKMNNNITDSTENI